MILSQHTSVSLSGSCKADAEPFVRLVVTSTSEIPVEVVTQFTLDQFDIFIEQCREQREHTVEMKKWYDREHQKAA